MAALRLSAITTICSSPINHKARLFQRSGKAGPVTGLFFPGRLPTIVGPTEGLAHGKDIDNLGLLTDQLIQQNFAPAAVLVNSEGDILYFSGRTGKYLEPAAGKTNVDNFTPWYAKDCVGFSGGGFRALEKSLICRSCSGAEGCQQ